jgi:hypothetical protein
MARPKQYDDTLLLRAMADLILDHRMKFSPAAKIVAENHHLDAPHRRQATFQRLRAAWPRVSAGYLADARAEREKPPEPPWFVNQLTRIFREFEFGLDLRLREIQETLKQALVLRSIIGTANYRQNGE